MSPENLPDFCRLIWVSAEARSVWEPRITAIGEHFAAAERASVEAGLRSAALQTIPPEQLPELARRAAEKGLVVTPLESQGRSPHGYAASTIQQSASDRWVYRIALTTLGAAGPFVEAWQRGHDETMGQLLGYPECCRRFFDETWGVGSVDPTWEMADPGDGPIEANILLRWIGVRYVPHLPCGFRCKGTIELGRKFHALIPQPEREWMDELLSMPMLWSSLHGIGEVVTPIVTLNFRSDVAELREITRQGTSYPEDGACGLRFPYRLPTVHAVDERLWTDNGFSSRDAMNKAHAMIIRHFGPETGPETAIIDLGAGNGELLRKLRCGVGVESDPDRVARRVWPAVKLARIQDAEGLFSGQRFAVAMISVRRFEELSEDELRTLCAWLESSVERVLVYQYEAPSYASLVCSEDITEMVMDCVVESE